MLYNPFKSLRKREWTLWIISLIVVSISIILSPKLHLPPLAASLIGVTALIFVAKGDVWGQILSVIFAVLYSITSFEFRYYGEMITYLGMTAPIALMSVFTWLKNPYEKGKNEVKIARLSLKQKIWMIILSILVTTLFYFILKAFNTPNLFFSTLSVLTSFLAVYLSLFRSSYYAIAYSLNDIVLIILWILAAKENPAYTPMIFCFVMFFVNDIYGFLSWKIREKRQKLNVAKKP